MNTFGRIIITFIWCLTCASSMQDVGSQSRIISSSGNLIFNSGEGKDFCFVTTGNGRILLNDGDLTNVTNLDKMATETLHRINDDYQDISSRLESVKRIMVGRQGVFGRIRLLELGSSSRPHGNFTAVSYNYRLDGINRRIRVLERKVNRLTLLLVANECSVNPCRNGGTCQDMFGSYMCHCPEEWEGSNCERDVNECTKYAGTNLGCQNGVTCVNKPGSYECVCASGWFGTHCIRTSGNCNNGSVIELCGHGLCIPQNGGYKCLCDQGWTNEGTNPACVKDVDECSELTTKTPSCSINPLVPCINVPGTFYCGNCPTGYSGNGYYCNDVDECTTFNGGCSVNPMVQCINILGSRMCGSCPAGYEGDGTTCTFQGICRINNGGCYPFGQCHDNPRISSTYVECSCPPGYAGNGIGPSGCQLSTSGVDPCLSNPCQFGTCESNTIIGTYICHCNQQYTGTNCNIRKDPCQSHPCLNGATCLNIADLSFRCICPSGFTDDICGTERQACGGHLRQFTGSLKYPATASLTPSPINCVWTIETDSARILRVTFTEFHVQDSNNCQTNWFELHDGINTASRSIGRFCGDNFPTGGFINSTHNSIYVWLRSSSATSHVGFALNWTSAAPVCGGDITVESQGILTSPGFPDNYPLNRDCYWNLDAPKQKRIQFHFFSLNVGNNPNCSYDFVKVYEGETPNLLLAQYCNTTLPEPLASSSSNAIIYFHSDSRDSYSGFRVAYSLLDGIDGCGGIYTGAAGEMSSPTMNNRYLPNMHCEYKISVPENSRIKITFLTFELEGDSECYYDYVQIFEGTSSASPMVGRYCGKRLPPTYTSLGRNIVILFVSDYDTGTGGFRVKYETVCGGKYSEPSGVITSPGFPQPYKTDLSCIYEIVQPLDKSITLTFIDFDLEINSFYENCTLDFVEIRDGEGENSTLIGRYCYQSPPVIQSTYNYLWFKFETDSSVSERGFKANYTTEDLGCGGILKNSSGTIKSHEGLFYSSNLNCTWIIVAPLGHFIELSWLSFMLEVSISCSNDYVEILDGYSGEDYMGKYCGEKLPPIITSPSNVIRIKFVTDYTISYAGFEVSYNIMSEATACGGVYHFSSGIIKSPNFPYNYPGRVQCNWTITADPGEQIMLYTQNFTLENSSSCNLDYLEIRNGGSQLSPLIGRYCGTKIPKTMSSQAHKLYIYFKTDFSVSYSGFKFNFESTATGCGGILTSPEGTIVSPNYPEPYNHDAECNWRISVNAGSYILLNFTDLNLEYGSNGCSEDYVDLYDGPNLFSKLIGRFCDSSLNFTAISTSNHVTVKFISDYSWQGRGFSLKYSAVCQNTEKGFRGVIESPNYPNNPETQKCNWKIELAKGNKINITFTSFDLSVSYDPTEGNNCSSNYLQVKYQGSEDGMTTLGTYCGLKIPDLLTINSNLAEIAFVTDYHQIGTGFRLEWQLYGCGGKLTRPNGIISTPNYPKIYPKDIQCDWIIQTDYGSSVQITFTDIDFEKSLDCETDYVQISNGPDESYPVIAKICTRNTKPLVVTSIENFMYITFRSDAWFAGKGFNASYVTLPTRCGGKITASSGSIHSPNYPANYDSDNCDWLIEIEEGHVIDLEFNDVNFYGNCSTNYVVAFDGSNELAPVLYKACASTKPNSTFTSTLNKIFLKMRTSNDTKGKGFLATYYTGCGGRIETNTSGLIRSSLSLIESRQQYDCSWTIISTDPTQHISLTISRIDEMRCSGTGNNINIYDGDSSTAPLVKNFCGNKLPPTITSVGNMLHVEIVGAIVNFVASYSVLDSICGGTFSNPDGYFSTPNYPNPYPLDVQCEWTIRVAPGNKISLSFNAFELVSSERCNLDFLEVRENNGTGKLLGTFCDSAPTNITQEGNLWMLFKSTPVPGDNSGATAQGFLAEYSLIHGIDLSGPFGEIASPLYPDDSIRTGTYSWRITVEFGKKILIRFKEFSVGMNEDRWCPLTYMDIFDGFDENALKLKHFCGLSLPDPFETTSNIIYIQIVYDSFSQGTTFLLEWLEVNGAKGPIPKPNGCGSDSVISISNSTKYNLTSPGYPNGYKVNLHCEWIFTTSPDYHLGVDFRQVDLETMIDGCILDKIDVYTGIGGIENWDLHKTVCYENTTDLTFDLSSNFIKIVFESDSSMNGSGFNALVYRRCGGNLEDQHNGVISANVSNYIYHSNECQWNITVRPGRTIKAEFTQLNLINDRLDAPCIDYIMLKNGRYPNSPTFKYCDNTTSNSSMVTTGNFLFVHFIQTNEKTSFTMTYQELSQDCEETIVLSKFQNLTYISSPNYPNIPSPYTECFWTIIGPPGELLRIDFKERFDLTNSQNCRLEGVEIRDGGSKYSPLLDTFCKDMPNSTYSSDNMLSVRFYTNVNDPKNGFKAAISIAKCGGTIRSKYGEVHSPNYNIKSQYPQNYNCTWNVVGPVDHYLILNFNKLDVNNCNSNDKVILEERIGFNNTLQPIGTYCSDNEPALIRTAGNEVLVHLITGSGNLNLAGFSLSFNASQEACGGKLTAESGLIESPGYPQVNHYRRFCQWLITVPKGRRVTLNFSDIDVGETAMYGRILIFDQDYSFALMSIPNSTNTLITSSDNTMLVSYWSYHATARRGFKARFSSDEPTICKGDFNQRSGLITNLNESIYSCTWKHSVDNTTNQTLSMSIAVNSTITPCYYPYKILVIYTEKYQNNIARFCKSIEHPTIVRSPYPITEIMASKSLYLSGTMIFSINYTTYSCGGIIIEEEGDIASPGFPNKFSDTIECAWLIKLPADQRLKINFTTTNLDDNCDYNYIDIYNGEFRHSPKFDRICGSSRPAVLHSGSNKLLIEYHSDGRSNANGFKFHYEPIMNGCSGTFHDDERIITTPNYPSNYPANSECLWDIRVSNGYRVEFEFIDRFYVEDSDSCKNDFVEIFNYDNEEYKSLGKLCGRNLVSKFTSASNRMKILFRSNDKIGAAGFKGKWQVKCGGSFEATANTKYLLSPRYPNPYGKELLCVYNVTSPNNYVNIVFEDFELEDSCRYDNVTITPLYYEDFSYGSSGYSNKARVYCGTQKPRRLHMLTGFLISFATDKWMESRGFKIAYYIDTCGGLITKPSDIASPVTEVDNVQVYSKSLNCFWNITAPENKNVVVRFTKLDLELSDTCRYDFVSVYDGITFNRTTRLAQLCGNLIHNLPVVVSKSNSMIIYMKTDNTAQSEGFKAAVYFTYGPSVGCGGKIIVNDTATIEAPVGLSNLECHWELFTERDHVLRLTFSELNLVPCDYNRTRTYGKQTCSCDIVEVRDGGSSASELMTRYCDNSNPPSITTSGASAWIRLNTIGSSTLKAFKVIVAKTPSICGISTLNVTNQTQILSSPSYPNPYPANIKCNWLLTSSNSMDTFYFKFTEFDLVNITDAEFLSETCKNDRVQISDKSSNKFISDGLGSDTIISIDPNHVELYGIPRLPAGVNTFCGRHALNFDHYTGQNEAVVSFSSLGSTSHGKGFRMEYQLAGCNRNFTATQGRFRASGLTGKCVTTIEVPENYTISLYFTMFIMLDPGDCVNTRMEIFDGDSVNNRQLGKLCGHENPNPIFSSSNKLLIHSYGRSGTIASYDVIYTSSNSGRGCGGIFYNYVGIVSSPLYPSTYREFKTCTWEIMVPQGMQVALRFLVFNVGINCSQNYVEIKTFNQDNSDLANYRFCNSDNPAIMKSENNRIVLSSSSSTNNEGSGWLANFLAVNEGTEIKWNYLWVYVKPPKPAGKI